MRRYQRAAASLSRKEFADFFGRWNARQPCPWPIVVAFDAAHDLLLIRDTDLGAAEISIARPSRTIFYQRGVAARFDFLWQEYLAREVQLSQGDLVVDIGANVGEFSIKARAIGAEVVAIEPDPSEYHALTCNLPDSKTLNLALWSERKPMTFYSKNDTGDSSLIETEGYAETITVEAHRLDDIWREQLGSRPIHLLKLEAEGAEPEIIAAGAEALRHTRFVTADVGPERGLAQENTVVPVLGALSDLGFKLQRFGDKRLVMLLKNERVRD